MTLQVLGPKGATALEGRGLSLETAARFGIYTGRALDGGGFEPDEAGSVVAFPFVDRGEVVAEKYRAPGKRFWQRAGGGSSGSSWRSTTTRPAGGSRPNSFAVWARRGAAS